MKKVIIYGVIILLSISSCSKETLLKNEAKLDPASTNSGVNAFPIKESYQFDYNNTVWNSCTNEWIALSGKGHYEVKGIITDEKETYVLHFNLAGVKGVGLNSGTEYVTTQTFNYTYSYIYAGEGIVYQQNATILFISRPGAGSFTVTNDWHLTVNAIGNVTFFFTTGGDVVTCK